jgi:dTDP-glucose 4,6-dehydratase
MTSFTPNNILITGGAGFIGANFIHYYLRKNTKANIINLDKLTYAGNNNNLEGIAHSEQLLNVCGDICDYDLVLSLLRKHEINTIINFAAESHVDRSISDPLIFAKSNVLGTANLLQAARTYWLTESGLQNNQCRFYQISTDEVFGSLEFEQNPSDENYKYHPRSPYSASKAGADHFVNAYYHTYGLPVVLSHCSNNYGPYQHNEKFIPTIINACLNWQPIPIYGNGKNIRDWIYVEDHCVGIEAVLKYGLLGESYNIGANNQLSNNALAQEICILMDKLFPGSESYRSLLSYVPDRLGHDFRYALDISKIQQELQWQPSVDLQTGLLKTINFYKKTSTSTVRKDSYENVL